VRTANGTRTSALKHEVLAVGVVPKSTEHSRVLDQETDAMKHLKSLYWISTGLMAAFMVMAGIPDVLQVPEARAIFRHLGYPAYLLPFLGTAKILGVVAVLVPRFQRLKEWAYAGLVFDVIGALYSHVMTGDPPSARAFPMIALLLVSASHLSYRTALASARRSGLLAAVARPSLTSDRFESGESY
jgi:uncharacterized membrane protein YphA (DoxX/SURF4 family)